MGKEDVPGASEVTAPRAPNYSRLPGKTARARSGSPRPFPVRALKKPVAEALRAAYLRRTPMIPDILLGIVFCLVFFGLGAVAFVYLSKGKN
jgi:hypothetical protein